MHLGVNGEYVGSVTETLQSVKNEIQSVIPEQLITVLFEKETFLSRQFNDLVLDNINEVKNYNLFSKGPEKKIFSVK